MNTGTPDQAQRVDEVDGLNGPYKFVDGYDEFMFVDNKTNWLEHFSLERGAPDESGGGSALLFIPGGLRSKTWAGGTALLGAGLALLIAGVLFIPRSAEPPTALARGPVEAPAPVSEATAAQPDITPLTPPSSEPAPAPEPGPSTVSATASPPAVAFPVSIAPALDAAATRPASVPAAPVTTAASTDAPPIFVPAVQSPPASAPSTPVALEAVATSPAVAAPAPTSSVPSVAVAPPPAAAPSAATTAVAPAPAPAPAVSPPAVSAVVSARELETRAIQTVLGRYREAFNALDARRAFDVWPSVNEKDLARAFESIEEQELSFDQCRIEVVGVRAEAACTGTARFVPRVGNRAAKAQARQWQFEFRKATSGWVINRVEAR